MNITNLIKRGKLVSLLEKFKKEGYVFSEEEIEFLKKIKRIAM